MDDSSPLPDIPECTVTLDEHGTYHLKHNGTGEEAVACSEDDAELQGAILRSHAALTRTLPFRTGDPM